MFWNDKPIEKTLLLSLKYGPNRIRVHSTLYVVIQLASQLSVSSMVTTLPHFAFKSFFPLSQISVHTLYKGMRHLSAAGSLPNGMKRPAAGKTR